MALDPRFISGVYNYCDRWCERCPLTSRCLTYAMEQDGDASDPALQDITNRAFWQRLEGILREAHELLDEILRERGIELPPADAEATQAFLKRSEDAREHPCAAAAATYARGVKAWLEGAGPRLQARGETLDSQHRMGLSIVDPEADAERLRDAVEVIQWYQNQIAVKIMRAVGTAARDDAFPDELDRSDADGSAKVALLGMDRSVAAWAELLRQMPEEEDRILPLLVTLGRLRRDVEAIFPNARAFVRPGFDTGEVGT
ncbi:MAG: hypothetical protein A2Z31_08650 [candidate division NC10 bacterium RBG_16_65_8]|nr:MAG: hypothetical protein A2Z31_08650 [candidate division NC10 bacterium RBG_16_65_8]